MDVLLGRLLKSMFTWSGKGFAKKQTKYYQSDRVGTPKEVHSKVLGN